MADFLTIDGDPYEVLTENAAEQAPAFGGWLKEFSWNGTPRFVAGGSERRVRAFGLGLMSMAAYELFRAKMLLGPYTCAGDALGAGAKECLIEVDGAEYIDNKPGFYIQANIVLTETGA
jgi:hypothetical protein